MNFNDYQELAQRTANKALTNAEKIENGCMGLCGEAGECIDHLKKASFQGHSLNKQQLAKELGDVLWYCAELASGLGMKLDDIAQENIDKLRKRYPEGFAAEKSLHREAGDI